MASRILALFIAVLCQTSIVWAGDESLFRWGGAVRARMISDQGRNLVADDTIGNNETPDNYYNKDANQTYWEQRTQFHVGAQKGETLQAYINVVAAGTWGRDFANGDTARDLSRSNPDNQVILHEGWGWYKMTDYINFKFGRWSYQLADGSVIDFNNSSQIPIAFDGVVMNGDFGFASVDVLGAKLAEYGVVNDYTTSATPNLGTPNDLESNMYGVSGNIKNLPSSLKLVNIHYIREQKDLVTQGPLLTTSAALSPGLELNRAGLTIKGSAAGFDYRGTAAYVHGLYKTDHAKENDLSVDATMLDTTLGFTIESFYEMRIGGTAHYDTGDQDATDKRFQKYLPFLYSRSKAGALRPFEWGNMTYYRPELSAVLAENTQLMLSYTFFQRTSKQDSVTSIYSSQVPAAGDNSEVALGDMFEVNGQYIHNDDLTLELVYAWFTAGPHFTKNKGPAGQDERLADNHWIRFTADLKF